jgi:hypothetical protein
LFRITFNIEFSFILQISTLADGSIAGLNLRKYLTSSRLQVINVPPTPVQFHENPSPSYRTVHFLLSPYSWQEPQIFTAMSPPLESSGQRRLTDILSL